MSRIWGITLAVSYAVCASLWVDTAGQEYLPPKSGGKKGGGDGPMIPASYNFSYNVEDNNIKLDFGHNEKRNNDRITGSYHVLLPDGRMQLVEYEAGPDGYKPLIMYMGTATYPDQDKFDGYHYNAASNRASVRHAAPRGTSRHAAAAVAAAAAASAIAPAPAVPPNAAVNSTSEEHGRNRVLET